MVDYTIKDLDQKIYDEIVDGAIKDKRSINKQIHYLIEKSLNK